MTTLPALSTPCTWNTFLARSTPMVSTCIWTTPSGDSLFNNHPMAHSMPGAGVVHHITSRNTRAKRRLDGLRLSVTKAGRRNGHKRKPQGRRRSGMTRYLISFDDGAMVIPEQELPAVGEAAHAVVRAAQ